MSFILNWIRTRNENRTNENKQASLNNIDTFVDYIYPMESVQFNELYSGINKWLNLDSKFGFHDQYISTLTISLITFLQTIKKIECDRKVIIKSYLENLLEMIIQDDKHSLYDYPKECDQTF